jgi:hypothetical protein
MASFEREKGLVVLLMQRLGLSPDEYRDPSATGAGETGADVAAVIKGHRIGIQVTELDTGETPGVARADEKKDARAGQRRGSGVYGGWAQNDAGKVLSAIQQAVARKVAIAQRHDFRDFDEVWLLVSCGVPELGAVISTFVMTPWLDGAALDQATAGQLTGSKYARAFVHPVLGVEKALYEWRGGSAGWSKSTVPLPPADRGPDFWEYKNDPDLLNDPEGWQKREVERFLAELRQGPAETRS